MFIIGKREKFEQKLIDKDNYRVRQIPFVLENVFCKFLFLFESTIIPVNNGK